MEHVGAGESTLHIIAEALASPGDPEKLSALIETITLPLRSDSKRSRYHKVVASLGGILSHTTLDAVLATTVAIHRALPGAADAEVSAGVLIRGWASSRDSCSGVPPPGVLAELVARCLVQASALLCCGSAAAATAAAAFDAVREVLAAAVSAGGDPAAWTADPRVTDATVPLEERAAAFVSLVLSPGGSSSSDPLPGSGTLAASGGGHLRSQAANPLHDVRAVLACRRVASAAQPGLAWGRALPEAAVLGLVDTCIRASSWMLAEEAALEVGEGRDLCGPG